MRSAALILILLPVLYSLEKYDYGSLVINTCTKSYPGKSCGEEELIKLNTNRCFRLYNTPLNFSAAEASCACECTNGHLLSLHNLDEYNEVVCELWRVSKVSLKPVWIGLKKSKGSTSYDYTDGTKLDFNRWLPDAPRDTTKDNVVCVQMNDDTWGRWSMKDCAAELPYICVTKM